MGADILPPDILIRAFDLIFERLSIFPSPLTLLL